VRICLLSYRGNPFSGGQGVYVTELGKWLARLGHEVHLISGPPYPRETEGIALHRLPGRSPYLRQRPPARDLGRELAADLHPLALYERAAHTLGLFPDMASFSLRAWRHLRGLSKTLPFDIVHDNQGLGWGLIPLNWLEAPVVATVHHPLHIDRARAFEAPTSFAEQWRRVRFYPLFMQGAVARRMERLLTPSRASAEAIEAHFRVPRGRVRVVYNGVDSDLFHPEPGIRRVPGRILFVGNLADRNKGALYLLRAMARLRPPAHLAVIGAGPSPPDWVEREIARLGIAGRVSFEVQLSPRELVPRYASAEIAVSPSLFEGFGFPAAEAMACGLPVVAASGGALPEIVGEAGLLVPPRDPERLAAALERLLQDAALRGRLGRAARERAVERFRWERAARETAEVYREAIDAHHRL
jgi:glycosyltransferase involved in cell wall biosynthesis